MEIFIDSANIAEIEKWLKMGILDGVTTTIWNTGQRKSPPWLTRAR